jgi:hypothetical protein
MHHLAVKRHFGDMLEVDEGFVEEREGGPKSCANANYVERLFMGSLEETMISRPITRGVLAAIAGAAMTVASSPSFAFTLSSPSVTDQVIKSDVQQVYYYRRYYHHQYYRRYYHPYYRHYYHHYHYHPYYHRYYRHYYHRYYYRPYYYPLY